MFVWETLGPSIHVLGWHLRCTSHPNTTADSTPLHATALPDASSCPQQATGVTSHPTTLAGPQGVTLALNSLTR